MTSMSQTSGQRHNELSFSIVQAVRVGHFLRIVFDQPLDPDMPPDLEDVSVVLPRAASAASHQIVSPIAIQLRNVERDSNVFSVLTLVFESELKNIKEVELRYHPHQWFMWSLSKDEPIPAFVMPTPVSHRPSDAKTHLQPSQLQKLKQNASNHFLSVKRNRPVSEGRVELERIQTHQIDVNLNKELIQHQSISLKDFKAEAGEMWLTITDVVICQPSADEFYQLRLTTLEAIPDNCVLRVAFQAKGYPIAATDGSSVDRFFLETELGTSKGTSTISNNADTRFDAQIDLDQFPHRPIPADKPAAVTTQTIGTQTIGTQTVGKQDQKTSSPSIKPEESSAPDQVTQDRQPAESVDAQSVTSTTEKRSAELDSETGAASSPQPQQEAETEQVASAARPEPKRKRRRPRTGNDPVNEFDGLFSQPVSDHDLLEQLEDIVHTRPKQRLPFGMKVLGGVVAVAVIWLVIALLNLFVLLPSGSESLQEAPTANGSPSTASDGASPTQSPPAANNSQNPATASVAASSSSQPVSPPKPANDAGAAGCSLNFSSGNQYAGECDPQNKPHGRGVYTWASGSRYEGQFSHGKREGQGQMLYASGSRYQGSWVADKKQGQGTYWVDNGDRFEGQFDAGRMTENGTCYPKSGKSYSGFCRN